MNQTSRADGGWLAGLRGFVSRLAEPGGSVQIDPTSVYQTVEGWGTSLAWWGHAIGGWSEATRSRVMDLLFNPATGLGLTAVRYNIGGGDDPAHHHMRPGGDVPGYQPSPGEWDWNADANQRTILREAIARGASHSEAFSNSPPYWMTGSGCASGAEGGGNNLRDDSVDAFAAYLAAVVAHFHDEWNVTFRTVEPFNEPSAPHWTAGRNQEGCHISRDQQRDVIVRLAAHLSARGVTGTAIAAADDFSIDDAVLTLGSYDPATRALVAQINSHSYSGTQRADLRTHVASAGKRLWMSEYGNGGGAHDHGAIGPALRLAGQIRRDMTDLQPVSWVYWQAVENEQGNNWGFIHATFAGPAEDYWLTKQYHAMAQYSRFIRPGYRILAASDARTLAAYDGASRTLVTVYDNGETQDAAIRLDLTRFGSAAGPAVLYRTSSTEDSARVGEMPLSGRTVTIPLAAQSITTCVVSDVLV